jgi:hypothetical protein
MKITANQLRRIINEEVGKALNEVGDEVLTPKTISEEEKALLKFSQDYRIPTTNLYVEKGRIMVRVGNRTIPSMLVAEVLGKGA